MQGLRARLKQSTQGVHERLESHPTMMAYAAGDLSAAEYQQLLKLLLEFWCSASPASGRLPAPYHQFLDNYRLALAEDAQHPASTDNPRQFDEIGFFYVLLGSSHGARFMLRSGHHAQRPAMHLSVLAEQGKALWPGFVKEELTSVEEQRQAVTLESAEAVFDALYNHIDNKKLP